MERRADVSQWVEFQWPYLLKFLGGRKYVNDLAYQTGAFERARKFGTPEDLLRVLLIRTGGDRSLMDTAALAAEAGLVDVSDAALVKRFAKAGPWLGSLVGGVLNARRASVAPGWRLRIFDATVVGRAGARGTDHRLHLGLDAGRNCVDDFELTSARGGETLDRFTIGAREIAIADAGYGHRDALARVAEGGGHFIVRFAWSNIPLQTPEGESFDLVSTLEKLPEAEAGEFAVQFRNGEGKAVPVRLVATRKTELVASATRRRLLAEARRKGRQTDMRTLRCASFFFVLTNVPAELSPTSVLDLYGYRWQIELKFKALKSLLHLDNVPARTDEALRVWVLAKLLLALLIDTLVQSAESFSPWGYPLTDTEHLASDPSATRHHP